MNGSKPESLKHIETAHEHGWLDCDPTNDDKTFAALNRLVASVFSGGSISEQTFSPSFQPPTTSTSSFGMISKHWALGAKLSYQTQKVQKSFAQQLTALFWVVCWSYWVRHKDLRQRPLAHCLRISIRPVTRYVMNSFECMSRIAVSTSMNAS